jgi:hypothetical protein
MPNLFGEPISQPGDVGPTLDRDHYLGRANRGFIAWDDEYGIAVLGRPTSRRLPTDWLELTRWCLRGEPNDGSRQWSRIVKHLRSELSTTTVVSYSDPSVGHTGALYRACNWWWAPTWMRLVPPPSRGGSWDGKTQQDVKDRWIFPLRRDERRVRLLRVDDSYVRRFPWAEYREPGGADWKGQP